jgi:hypothetical protein
VTVYQNAMKCKGIAMGEVSDCVPESHEINMNCWGCCLWLSTRLLWNWMELLWGRWVIAYQNLTKPIWIVMAGVRDCVPQYNEMQRTGDRGSRSLCTRILWNLYELLRLRLVNVYQNATKCKGIAMGEVGDCVPESQETYMNCWGWGKWLSTRMKWNA